MEARVGFSAPVVPSGELRFARLLESESRCTGCIVTNPPSKYGVMHGDQVPYW